MNISSWQKISFLHHLSVNPYTTLGNRQVCEVLPFPLRKSLKLREVSSSTFLSMLVLISILFPLFLIARLFRDQVVFSKDSTRKRNQSQGPGCKRMNPSCPSQISTLLMPLYWAPQNPTFPSHVLGKRNLFWPQSQSVIFPQRRVKPPGLHTS